MFNHPAEPQVTTARAAAAALYTVKLAGTGIVTPTVPDGFVSSWAQYTVLLETKEKRDALKDHLKTKGIPSMVYYPRGLHTQEAYRGMEHSDADYPNTVEATKRVLSLPMHPYLTEEDVGLVCEAIKETR